MSPRGEGEREGSSRKWSWMECGDKRPFGDRCPLVSGSDLVTAVLFIGLLDEDWRRIRGWDEPEDVAAGPRDFLRARFSEFKSDSVSPPSFLPSSDIEGVEDASRGLREAERVTGPV